MLVVLTACEKDDQNLDTSPPGVVSNVQITPTNGGALITYDLPNDNDVFYVKASYKSTLGKAMFKVSSYYDNNIELEGYNDINEHEVKIEVYDRSNNVSEPVIERFSPLESHIELAKQNMVITPDFGGVKLVWDNVSAKTLFAYLFYTNSAGQEITEILPSSLEHEKKVVRGMDTIRKEFFVQLEDFHGNKTEIISKGEHSPLFEEEIDKSKWKLVSNISVDGNEWEGETVNLWDGVVDTKDNSDDNSYCMISRRANGGQLSYPLDIVIDMNAAVVMNRFVVWQRAFWYGNESEYFYYQNENFKAFNLYASNDLDEWILIGEYSIEDPKDTEGNVPSAAIQEAIDGHGFELEEYTQAFRYLKFSVTENFGSEEYVNISELSIFGTQDELNN